MVPWRSPGRAKDTIVLSNGENIEPGPLEEALVASPLIEQVMLVGRDERQLGALLVPQVGADPCLGAGAGGSAAGGSRRTTGGCGVVDPADAGVQPAAQGSFRGPW